MTALINGRACRSSLYRPVNSDGGDAEARVEKGEDGKNYPKEAQVQILHDKRQPREEDAREGENDVIESHADEHHTYARSQLTSSVERDQ